MRRLVDITGTEYVAPACPNCSTKNTRYALQQIEEIGADGQKAFGVWRCNNCFHAFRYQESI